VIRLALADLSGSDLFSRSFTWRRVHPWVRGKQRFVGSSRRRPHEGPYRRGAGPPRHWTLRIYFFSVAPTTKSKKISASNCVQLVEFLSPISSEENGTTCKHLILKSWLHGTTYRQDSSPQQRVHLAGVSFQRTVHSHKQLVGCPGVYRLLIMQYLGLP